uniref:Interferon regulatory factor n=1 Tax=Leptobrachium leishanense TaxID=445787 RepID=A0A8C5WBG6_9ANUR
MPVTRLRMRPWLEKQIESNSIPGLAWVNKDEKVFQIPWKHAARQGWDINKDACLFRSWASHTGRYKEGQKEPDAKTWKANFRCAMNSLPDIKEVKDRSIYKGSSAVRVYRMLPAQAKIERKERKSKSSKDAKNKLSKQDAGISQEEEEEAIRHAQLAGDHSYTASAFEEQDIAIGNVEIMDLLESSDVTSGSSMKDWDDPMQLPDSTNGLYSFQVSPMTSSSEDDEGEQNVTDDFFHLTEQSTDWQHTNINGNRYFTNESGIQSSGLTELSPVFDELREIEFRLSTDLTDLKTGNDIWKENQLAWSTGGLPAFCSV